MPNTSINTGEVSIDGTIPISGTVTAVQPDGSKLHVDVDNFPATQPISGTVTANQGTPGATAWPVDASGHTVPISAASLPLPANAAEETGGNLASLATHQTDGTQKTQVTNFPAIQPVSGTVTVQQSSGASLHVDVDNFPATQNTSDKADGTVGGASPTTAIQAGGSDGTDIRALSVDSSGHLLILPFKKNTYSAAGFGNVSITAAQPVFLLQNPSANTKTFKLRKLMVGVNTSNTATGIDFTISLATSLTVLGSGASTIGLTATLHDSNNPSSNAIPAIIVTFGTGGSIASGNTIRTVHMDNGASTLNPAAMQILSFSDILESQAITLHPGQELQIFLSVVNVNESFHTFLEWTEE